MRIRGQLQYSFSENGGAGSESVIERLPRLLRTTPHYWRLTMWAHYLTSTNDDREFRDVFEACSDKLNSTQAFMLLRQLSNEMKAEHGTENLIDAGWVMAYGPSRHAPVLEVEVDDGHQDDSSRVRLARQIRLLEGA